MIDKTFQIDKLQFYWRFKDSPEKKSIFPDFLPFELTYDRELGLFKQKVNKKILGYLSKVYKLDYYNIGNIQKTTSWTGRYKDSFMSFLNFSIKSHDQKIKDILEVGCGSCLLLEDLKKRGYKVIGIDPSTVAKKEGEKRRVDVIVGYYPNKNFRRKFDVILHSHVLEHISTPLEFLKYNFDQLNEGGMLILAVPDNTASIVHGDISMLYHQHINYFDKDSLSAILRKTGFSHIRLENATFGGSLYCVARKNLKVKALRLRRNDMFDNFLKKEKRVVKNFSDYVSKILNKQDKTLGFYAPIRTLPYLAFINLYKNFRFFDDTPEVYHKYVDGINVKIENFEDLKKKPVSDLLIMSPTFGGLIEKKVKNYFYNKIKTKKITDFFV